MFFQISFEMQSLILNICIFKMIRNKLETKYLNRTEMRRIVRLKLIPETHGIQQS